MKAFSKPDTESYDYLIQRISQMVNHSFVKHVFKCHLVVVAGQLCIVLYWIIQKLKAKGGLKKRQATKLKITADAFQARERPSHVHTTLCPESHCTNVHLVHVGAQPSRTAA